MNKISKYINIDQKACISHEIQNNTRLTLKHSTILDYICKQIAYKQGSKFKKYYIKTIKNQVYVRIDYQDIINELPLLKIGNKKSIVKYVKDLVHYGVLDKKIIKNIIYYRLEKSAYKFIAFNNKNQDTHKKYDPRVGDIKNFITINQHAFMKMSQQNNIRITLKHSTILDFIYYFTRSENKKILRKNINQKAFTWISYKKIIADLPLLKIKNKTSIANYINDLIDCEILEKYTDYQDRSKVYLRITDQALNSIFNTELEELTTCDDQEIELENSQDEIKLTNRSIIQTSHNRQTQQANIKDKPDKNKLETRSKKHIKT